MALDLQGLTQDQQFAKAAEFAGVPESVFRGMWKTESGEGKNKLSPVGAEGDFQVMPATRKTWEQRTGRAYNANDFGDSLALAALTMHENMGATKGNVVDALRMYNAGPDRSRWDNPETRAYAGKVLGQEVPASSEPPTDVSNMSAFGEGDPPPPSPDEVWNMRAWDIRNQDAAERAANHTEHLTRYEQGMKDMAGLTAAVGAPQEGTAAEDAAFAARSTIDPLAAIESETGSMVRAPSMSYDDTVAFHDTLEHQRQMEEEQAKLEKYDWGDKFGAAFDNNTLTATISHLFTDQHGFLADDNFDVMDAKTSADIFSWAHDADDIKEQNEAVSPAHLAAIRADIQRRRDNDAIIAADSSAGAQMGYNLLAGVVDPAGWAAGFGVSKAFELAGLGARVAFKAGKAIKGYGLMAGEGAVGNLATMGAINLAGGHVTSGDYAFAAGTGLFFGAAMAPFAHFGAAKEATRDWIIKVGQENRENAAVYHKSLLDEATTNLGPNATEEQITKEAARLDTLRQQRIMEGVLGAADAHEQILPKMSPEEMQAFRDSWKGDITERTEAKAADDGGLVEETPKATPVDTLHSRLHDIAARMKLTITEGDGLRPQYHNNEVRMPKMGTPIEGAQSWEQVLAHEMGHAIEHRLRTKLNLDPKQMRKRIKNWGEWVAASKEYRPDVHNHENPQARAHALSPREVMADAIAGVLAGKVDPKLVTESGLGITPADMVGVFPEATPAAPAAATVAPAKAAAPKPSGNVLPKFLPGALLTSRSAVEAMAKKYKLDLTISDGAERALAAEMYARAEKFMENNPVDKERASKLLEMAGMESTAQRMLLSDNPLMQMTASVLLESSSGMSGRRATAAMTAKMRENIYVHNILNEYERSATNFRKSRGVNAMLEAWNNGPSRREFDRLVYEARDRRLNGVPDVVSHPDVMRVADLLDSAYERMRVEQKHVGTLGASRLAETEVRGYQPRRWAVGMLRDMGSTRYEAFVGAIADQMEKTEGYDKDFAKKFAIKYVEMARRKAAGGYDVPANLHDEESADMVRDALKAAGATEMEADSLMGRFSRGGAGHTKNRIEMDMTREYKDKDGKTFRLMDYADTDNMSLLRNYARRTAGEVGLAKFGVMGEQGLKQLRVAMEASMDKSQTHVKELEAFDQIASEFLGKPVGQATPLGKWADNSRIFASAIKLGGMGFTQMGETANAFAALGVEHATKGVASMPRMLKEARAIARGEHVSNPIIGSLEEIGGHIGVEGYTMQGLYDVHDDVPLYGKESLDRVSKMLRAGNHAVRVLSGHRAVMAAQVRGLSEQITLKALRYIREGGDDAALRDMGFSDKLVAELKSDLPNIVKYDGEGRIVSVDLTKMKDMGNANLFTTAVKRGASQIIQETFIGETGKWAHNGLLKMLFQFRTFSLISVEKQWGRQVGVHGLTKTIGYTLGAMSLALPLHAARVAAKAQLMDGDAREQYLDQQLSAAALGRATMNYASTLGLAPDMLDAGAAVVGKGSYAYGGRGTGRGGNLIGDSIAPAVGTVNDVAKLATQHDAHTLARLMPGGSIPLFQAGIGLIGEAAQDVNN